MTEHQDTQHSWSFLDLAATIWRRRRLFFGTVILVTVTAIVTSLVIPAEYTARASFIVPPDEGGGISSFLNNPLGAVLGKRGTASLDRLVAFLNSEEIRRILVAEYDLMRVYEVERHIDALDGLKNHTVVAVSPEGVVEIMVTDRSRDRAAAISNRYLSIVDSLYSRSETWHASQVRRFMEGRVQENRQELATAEEAARRFAEEHGVVSLSDQVSALVQEMAGVEGEIRALDVKIGAARQIYGPAHSSVRQMQLEKAQLEVQRRRLMQPDPDHPAADPLLSFHEVPARALEYARLEREIEIQSIIQQILLQEYERARLDEARTVPSLTVVDIARPPEMRSWPMRGRIVILSGIMAVIWGILLAVLADAWPGMVRKFHGKLEADSTTS